MAVEAKNVSLTFTYTSIPHTLSAHLAAAHQTSMYQSTSYATPVGVSHPEGQDGGSRYATPASSHTSFQGPITKAAASYDMPIAHAVAASSPPFSIQQIPLDDFALVRSKS